MIFRPFIARDHGKFHGFLHARDLIHTKSMLICGSA